MLSSIECIEIPPLSNYPRLAQDHLLTAFLLQLPLWSLESLHPLSTQTEEDLVSILDGFQLFTWNGSQLVHSTITDVSIFVYISIIAFISLSNTTFLLSDHQITSFGTRSKAFSKSTNTLYKFLPTTSFFSINCFIMKITSVVSFQEDLLFSCLPFSAATTLLTFLFIGQYYSFNCWSFFLCHILCTNVFSL